MERSWYVVHRYKEFDALRMFIAARKSLRSERYWKRIGAEPTFPAKRALSMQLSFESQPQYIKERILGLEKYLNFHISMGGHEIQSVIDAIASFLEVCRIFFYFRKLSDLSMQLIVNMLISAIRFLST